MTVGFQDNILKFIVSSKEGKEFLPMLDASFFDIPEKKIVFDLLDKYHTKYGTIPIEDTGKSNLLEFFDKQTKTVQGFNQDNYPVIERAIREIYVKNFSTDTVIIREEIVAFAKRKATKILFTDEAAKVATGDDAYFLRVLKRMGDVVSIGADSMEEAKQRGGFLLKDYTPNVIHSIVQGAPTYLHKLNRMTNSGGFKTPELIILMGAPKSFKTGLAINLAANYMRSGKKVYYIDCENGISAIKTRFLQCLGETTRAELRSGEMDNTMQFIVDQCRKFGGDVVVDHYPANTKDCRDVEANLQYYKDEFNWQPELIIWDYPDLMKPVDRSIKEKRLAIQAVYHDIIRLQNKWNTFGFGLSQVNKDAVGRDVIDMRHFSEDFGKAANAHGAFAICRTPEEQEAGMARLVPVMQREGVQYSTFNQCYLEINPEIQNIVEIMSDGDRMDAAITRVSDN